MKHFRQLLSTVLLLLAVTVAAQQANRKGNIISQEIAIAYWKTTTIVFPFPIASVDRGSQDILAQKAIGIENVLQVKAAQQDFAATNLTVITSDGNLYSFPVCYDENAASLTLTLPDGKPGSLIQFDAAASNIKKMESIADLALHERTKLRGVSEKEYGIALAFTGLHIHDDLIYYRITIENETNISYDIDQLRFFVRDQKRSKRTASQELEIQPVHVYRQVEKIPAQSACTFVCVLPKFTIPDMKNLVIQLVEKGGGRHLKLSVKHQKVDKPILIP
ncbi:conjugative transposon protein TraN [Flavobacterium subsaxonicum]|uniref:Conjugative transposon protein TraN n=1 Tax=Flavobacterium subsaxonicum WB 4.1-42 = DSM 21790 TaxID=1121898 RepID=A0A0A2N3L2_9FLAO|nr:conjugative transposon protein TraN [Flavobacterium subsaxonicum]KGO95045.1 hypothetical protein Q766_02750 [Flavobacterium subsaxonicum WB 4.1-42 = DSM 21790]